PLRRLNVSLGDNYASLEELRDRFPEIREDDTADDAAMERALDTASRWIEEYTGRQFNDAGTASARVYDPTTTSYTRVDDFHSLVDLAVRLDNDNDGIYETELAVRDFDPLPRNGIVHGRAGWPYSRIRA